MSTTEQAIDAFWTAARNRTAPPAEWMNRLSREEAYILSSVCVDLRISEIVDAPNWIVSAFLPEAVFV